MCFLLQSWLLREPVPHWAGFRIKGWGGQQTSEQTIWSPAAATGLLIQKMVGVSLSPDESVSALVCRVLVLFRHCDVEYLL